jgi:hypothetical protein
VEPVADIAVLGSLDGQVFFEETEQFESFCEDTKPVRLCRQLPEPGNPFPVYILDNDGEWVRGKARIARKDAARIWVDAEQPIKGGASGGPIVNERGQLVAIVSVFSEPYGRAKVCDGLQPLCLRALPVWALKTILGK